MKMKKIKGGTFMMGTNSEEGFLDDFEAALKSLLV